MSWPLWVAVGAGGWVAIVGGALAWFAGATRKPTPKPERRRAMSAPEYVWKARGADRL